MWCSVVVRGVMMVMSVCGEGRVYGVVWCIGDGDRCDAKRVMLEDVVFGGW